MHILTADNREEICRAQCVTAFERQYKSAPAQYFRAAVVTDGQILAEFNSPYASTTSADEPFPIASMTKCFAAVAILQLRDKGLLLLDTSIQSYLPWLSVTPWGQITISQLLSMRSGLPTDNEWADRFLGMLPEEATAFLEQEFLFTAAPGEVFQYSNVSYMILGRLISEVSGSSALQYIRENILLPLGMKHTVWNPVDSSINGFIQHSTCGEQLREPRFQSHADTAVFGGLHSTVADLGRWIRFMVPESPADTYESVLCASSRQEIQQPHVLQPAQNSLQSEKAQTWYGFGLNVYTDDGDICGHSGGLPGFGSHFRWSRKQRLGIIVFGNTRYYPASLVGDRCMHIVSTTYQASEKQISNLLQERAEALLAILLESHEVKLDELFAANFFQDWQREEFFRQCALLRNRWRRWKNEDDRYKIFPVVSWEPGLAAKITILPGDSVFFNLTPGEGSLIQKVIFAQS